MLLAAAALALAPTASASALWEGAIAFDSGPVETEYGSGWWSAGATATDLHPGYTWTATATIEGPGSPTVGVDFSVTDSDPYTVAINVHPAPDTAPLPVGTYSLTTSVVDGYGGSLTSEPVTLTVTPAELGLEVRMVADPSAADNVIITSRFTGGFVENFVPEEYPLAAPAPGGTWNIVVKDATGATAVEEAIERAPGGNVLAASFLWSGAEPGERYTATATFTPSGAGADNFVVAPATPFDFTASTQQRPVPTSTAASAAPAEDGTPAGTGIPVPLWALAVSAILGAALIALVVFLALRARPRPEPVLEVDQ